MAHSPSCFMLAMYLAMVVCLLFSNFVLTVNAFDVSFIPADDENPSIPLSANYRNSLRKLCQMIEAKKRLPAEMEKKRKTLEKMCIKLKADDLNIASAQPSDLLANSSIGNVLALAWQKLKYLWIALFISIGGGIVYFKAYSVEKLQALWISFVRKVKSIISPSNGASTATIQSYPFTSRNGDSGDGGDSNSSGGWASEVKGSATIGGKTIHDLEEMRLARLKRLNALYHNQPPDAGAANREKND